MRQLPLARRHTLFSNALAPNWHSAKLACQRIAHQLLCQLFHASVYVTSGCTCVGITAKHGRIVHILLYVIFVFVFIFIFGLNWSVTASTLRIARGFIL